jgi:hypothetical protein
MERDALRANPAYEQAREQLVRASLQHERLVQRLEESVREHPLYMSALDRVAQLERQLIVQNIQFAGTTNAYAQALEDRDLRFATGRRVRPHRYAFGPIGLIGPLGPWAPVGVFPGTGMQIGAPLP